MLFTEIFLFWVSYNLILKIFPNSSTAYNLVPHKIVQVLHLHKGHTNVNVRLEAREEGKQVQCRWNKDSTK